MFTMHTDCISCTQNFFYIDFKVRSGYNHIKNVNDDMIQLLCYDTSIKKHWVTEVKKVVIKLVIPYIAYSNDMNDMQRLFTAYFPSFVLYLIVHTHTHFPPITSKEEAQWVITSLKSLSISLYIFASVFSA